MTRVYLVSIDGNVTGNPYDSLDAAKSACADAIKARRRVEIEARELNRPIHSDPVRDQRWYFDETKEYWVER